jgi:hypothetical protein
MARHESLNHLRHVTNMRACGLHVNDVGPSMLGPLMNDAPTVNEHPRRLA